MSAETYTPYPGAAEFSARPKVETSRGTEVHSSRGDRLVNAANRLASFMDRLKGGRTEVVETAQDKLEQGRQFLKDTGEKAVDIAVRTGNVVGGAALTAAEFGIGATILAAETGARGAKHVKEAASNGIDTANAWLETKAGQVNDAIDTGIGKAVDFGKNSLNTAARKGAEIKEAAVGKYEVVRGFFRGRAETAKLNMEKMRRNWDRIRSGARQTFESGKAYAKETGERAKRNAKLARQTGQLALAHYRSNAVPVIAR